MDALYFTICQPSDLERIIEPFLIFAAGRKKIMLIAEMGAGKTTFVQAFCRHFHVTNHVTSPTFSLVNEYFYQNEQDKTQIIRHLDLYRLKNIEEAIDIGIEDYLYDEHYCFIEWPNLIEPLLLIENCVRVYIEIIPNFCRKIKIL